MKILNIQDTRQYEEGPNDKWIPIPGSGIENECERCTKTHEVHVIVQDGDKVFTVGTGCARQDDMITDKQARSAVSTAKTIAKLKARIEMIEQRRRDNNEAYAEIMYYDRPEIMEEKKSDRFSTYKMGTAVIGSTEGLTEERRQCLDNTWINGIIRSWGIETYIPAAYESEKKLARAEKKMAQLING